MNHLDRDRPPQHSLLSAIHSPHAAHANQFLDQERAPNDAPDQIVVNGFDLPQRGTATATKAIGTVKRNPTLMALRHSTQDSPTSEYTQTLQRRFGKAELGVLFANLWSLWLGLPLLHAHRISIRDILLAAVPLVSCGIGLYLSSSPQLARSQPGTTKVVELITAAKTHQVDLLLLVVSPVTLVVALANIAKRTGELPFGPLGLVLNVLALWAYGGACLQVRLPTLVDSNVVIAPIARSDALVPKHVRTTVLALLFGLGALGVGVIAPASTRPGAHNSDSVWTLLAVTVAAGLAVALAGMLLGRALRPATPKPPTPLWPWLLLSSLSLALFLVTLHA